MPNSAAESRRRPILWASLATLLVVGGVALWVLRPFKQAPETVAVERRDLREIVEVSGVVEPLRAVTLKAETSGRVQALVVAENARVATGATLLKVDATQAALALAQARANADAAIAQADSALQNARRSLQESAALQQVAVANARNQLAKARASVGYLARELARDEGLLREGAVARQAVEAKREQLRQAELDVRVARDALERARVGDALTAARNAVSQAETALANAREQGRVNVKVAAEALARTTVEAPFAGTLVDWQVEQGDLLAPGTPLGLLQDLDSLRLRLPVDELDLPRLRVGRPVAITFDAYPETPYAGTIASISRSSVAGTGNVQVFPVLVAFDSPDGRIKPGMSADAEVLVRELEQVLVVPIGAARRVGERTEVTVLRDGKPAPVAITPGINTLEYLEVKSGLAEGDRVLKNPAGAP